MRDDGQCGNAGHCLIRFTKSDLIDVSGSMMFAFMATFYGILSITRSLHYYTPSRHMAVGKIPVMPFVG